MDISDGPSYRPSSGSKASRSNRKGSKTPVKTLKEKKLGEDEFMAAAIGDTEWLRQSLRGSRGALTYDSNGLAPIHLASIHGRLDCLKLLIEKLNVDVNLPSHSGWRPIHLVISNQTGKRSYNCLMYLLSKGADHSITNEDGITPMHQAASEGHVQCLKTLIEVGGIIDGQDKRNMKPIDMSKLWGHRKCARVLAAETWHREKDGLAKEMKHFEKVKMAQVLQEIEQDDMSKPDQQLYGAEAYENWSRVKGKEPGKKKDTKQKPTTGLYKANSMKKPEILETSRTPETRKSPELKKTPERKMTPEAKGTSRKQTPVSRQTTDSTLGLYEEETMPQKSLEASNVESGPTSAKPFYNSNLWDKSTHLPKSRFPYTTNLTDYYPRDEYTMMPIYPLKKGSNSKPIPAITPQLKAQLGDPNMKSELPADFIERALISGADREVLFKCRNIIDAQCKKHYVDDDRIAKPETALHLSDPSSSLYRSALVHTRPTSLAKLDSRSSQAHSDFHRYDMKGVLQIMTNMNKPTSFPNIKGHHYDLYAGEVKN